MIAKKLHRFGVVVPSYNAVDTIREAIDSVLSQGHSDVNVYVVDGNSNDGTVEVLRSYEDRIRWLSEKDEGQTDAINKGMHRINAEIVTWLNADDRLLPGALTAVDGFFHEHPEVDFVYGDIEFVDRQGRLLSRRCEASFNKFILVYGHNLFADPTCFWRFEVFERVGLLNPEMEYSMDYEFWIRCVDAGIQFGQLRLPLAQFRIHTANKSIAHFREMRQEHFRVLIERRSWLKHLPTSIRQLALNLLLRVSRILKVVLMVLQRRHLPASSFSRLVKSEGQPNNLP